ncbi:hypothetical protein PENTCL1PPCAC_29271, partial [Pristionchus entomophagus]
MSGSSKDYTDDESGSTSCDISSVVNEELVPVVQAIKNVQLNVAENAVVASSAVPAASAVVATENVGESTCAAPSGEVAVETDAAYVPKKIVFKSAPPELSEARRPTTVIQGGKFAKKQTMTFYNRNRFPRKQEEQQGDDDEEEED